MKTIKRLGVVTMFTLLLTTSTFAGDMETGKTPPPPPPNQPSAMSPGEISTGGELQNPQAPSDSVEDIALDLLQTILAMF